MSQHGLIAPRLLLQPPRLRGISVADLGQRRTTDFHARHNSVAYPRVGSGRAGEVAHDVRVVPGRRMGRVRRPRTRPCSPSVIPHAEFAPVAQAKHGDGRGHGSAMCGSGESPVSAINATTQSSSSLPCMDCAPSHFPFFSCLFLISISLVWCCFFFFAGTGGKEKEKEKKKKKKKKGAWGAPFTLGGSSVQLKHECLRGTLSLQGGVNTDLTS